ncbi:MAG: methionine--tRNA ligase [Candidatus Zixiibacteriota bacterium]|jgi:methionyl-tRNA synthetase
MKDKSKLPFYITTPIYYVNDVPHIGHAYCTISADIVAKYQQLAHRETFFLTGTDEHGTKIAEAAEKAGVDPQTFCDRVVERFKEAWKNLSIDNDYFIRTTSQRHIEAVRKILDALRNARTDDGQEVVYSDYYEGLYCVGCEKYLTEKELVDGLCPLHRTPPEKVKEKNYFFRLTAFADKIKEKIESGEMLILPEERRREVLGLINQDLPDFSLSREHVTWGIPLTFDSSQVAYVWVDALSNYISAIGYGDDPKSFDKWWNKAEVVHLLGKDILKFHCLYWPAMLMAAKLKLPETLFVHGYFTVNGEKMSKSLGNQIDPNDMVDEFGPDGTRYLLSTQYPFGGDGDVQAGRFLTQYNSDLANDLGNLVSRVCKMIVSNFDGKLPERNDEIMGLSDLVNHAETLGETVYGKIEDFHIHNAIFEVMNLVRATNKFFNDAAPWTLKLAAEKPKQGGILYACCESLRIISILLFPVLPNKMRELRAIFSLDDSTLRLKEAEKFHALTPGKKINFEKPLFPRLEKRDSARKQEKAKESEKAPASVDGLLDISEFAKVKLRIAEVLEAEKVKGADKLLKLQIQIGDEKRQIVAGIAEHYAPEDLVGKKIVVVANLKPAKIRGIESNGMLLAAKSGKTLRLVTPDADLPSGATIS